MDGKSTSRQPLLRLETESSTVNGLDKIDRDRPQICNL